MAWPVTGGVEQGNSLSLVIAQVHRHSHPGWSEDEDADGDTEANVSLLSNKYPKTQSGSRKSDVGNVRFRTPAQPQ